MSTRIGALLLIASILLIVQAGSPLFQRWKVIRQLTRIDVQKGVMPPEIKPTATAPTTRAIQRAAAQYAYQVNDTWYVATRGEQPTPDVWFADVFEAAQDEPAVVGYYDPADPSKLYLPRPRRIGEYVMLFAVLPLLAAGVVSFFLHPPGDYFVIDPRPVKDNWHEIRPKYSASRRAFMLVAVAVAWNLVGTPAGLDFLRGEPSERGVTGNIIGTFVVAIGIALLMAAGYYAWLAKRMNKVIIMVNTPSPYIGEHINVRVEQSLTGGNSKLHKVRAGLTCTLSTWKLRGVIRTSGQKPFEHWNEGTTTQDNTHGRKRVLYEHAFRIPAGCHASTERHAETSYAWDLYVRLRWPFGPDYRSRHRIRVQSVGARRDHSSETVSMPKDGSLWPTRFKNASKK